MATAVLNDSTLSVVMDRKQNTAGGGVLSRAITHSSKEGLYHMEFLQIIRPLTQEERDAARENAQRAVVGNAPDRARFLHSAQSKYPLYARLGVTALCMVLLIAAFLPSAIRLHHIGVQTFMHAISDGASLTVAGWSAVFLAETGQLVFTLALAMLDANRTQRAMLYGGAALCTVFALVGNVQLAEPMQQAEMFAWLEAITPPLVVLFTAHVLKHQMLHSIEMRHASERDYQAALDVWKVRASAPEQDAAWMQKYANALRDAIRKANQRSASARQALTQLQRGDWFVLVQREMQADAWYTSASESQHEVQMQRLQEMERLQVQNENLQDAIKRLQSERSSNGHTGNHTGEIAIEQDGEMHSATCPHCGFTAQKRTPLAARNALAAHLRRCKMRPEMMQKEGA
jgi:hypothetical protein